MTEIVLLNRCSREGLQGFWERVAWSTWNRISAIALREGLFGRVGILSESEGRGEERLGNFHQVNRGLSTSRNSRRRSGGWVDGGRYIHIDHTTYDVT